mmetsp:Transcript_9951/g.18960  ORF Transcript_9951/g.18960 Transcript_9951/m.18960 type:complete len:205 (-) Transcript_9951:3-617(-)
MPSSPSCWFWTRARTMVAASGSSARRRESSSAVLDRTSQRIHASSPESSTVQMWLPASMVARFCYYALRLLKSYEINKDRQLLRNEDEGEGKGVAVRFQCSRSFSDALLFAPNSNLSPREIQLLPHAGVKSDHRRGGQALHRHRRSYPPSIASSPLQPLSMTSGQAVLMASLIGWVRLGRQSFGPSRRCCQWSLVAWLPWDCVK